MNNIVLIGRGGVGVSYAYPISKLSGVRLRVAADEKRVERYSSSPFFYNDEPLALEYFTPTNREAVDLIIIATKWSGYRAALDMCEILVGENTQILPLLNGLIPYDMACERFGVQRVLRGYYIGHTASLDGDVIRQDGVFRTVFGESLNVEGDYSERVKAVAALFDKVGLKYRIDADMLSSQWQKLVINVGANQVTGLEGGLSYGELHGSADRMTHAVRLMQQAVAVAAAAGVAGTDKMLENALASFKSMVAGDYSSMAQDVRAGRKTEVEIFAGYIVRLAGELGIYVPDHKQIFRILQ